MFRALLTLAIGAVLYCVLPVSSASACQMFADEAWAKEADLTGPCNLGTEPVTLALVDYTDMERLISYSVDWKQDLSDEACPRFLILTIVNEGGPQSYKVCNEPFPMDTLTKDQLLQRLRGIEPLFQRGDLDGKAILLAIKSEL